MRHVFHTFRWRGMALVLLALVAGTARADNTVTVNTSSWSPNPALVRQLIFSNVTSIDSSVPTPQNEDTVGAVWTYTTGTVYVSPTGQAGTFSQYTGNYVIEWYPSGGDDTQPGVVFNGRFWSTGYFLVQVNASVTYMDTTTNTVLATNTGTGYVGGSSSLLGGSASRSAAPSPATAGRLSSDAQPNAVGGGGGLPVVALTATISPTTATFGVDVSQTYTCTVSPSSTSATVAYQWSMDGTAISGSTGQTIKYMSSMPGSHNFTCAVSASDATTNYGNASALATAYVIGGPITGDNDIHYYDNYTGSSDFDVTAEFGHLSAAGSQPSGTTYSWTMAGNAKFCNSFGDPVNTITSAAEYRGDSTGSKIAGDVAATVAYKFNGVSVKSPALLITVHCPVNFTIVHTTPPAVSPPGPNVYSFTGQSLIFQITDGLGKIIVSPDARGVAINWNETWVKTSFPNFYIPEQGGPLDILGESEDDFSCQPVSQPDNDLCTANHNYRVGSITNTVGALVQTYTGVVYTTSGVKGNGFQSGNGYP